MLDDVNLKGSRFAGTSFAYLTLTDSSLDFADFREALVYQLVYESRRCYTLTRTSSRNLSQH